MEEKRRHPRERRVIRSIAFPTSLMRTINEMAWREGRSANQTIERLVIAGLRSMNEGKAVPEGQAA